MPKSGVNPNLYKPYHFEDHVWNLKNNHKSDLLELAERCVRLDKSYWFRLPESGVWVEIGLIADAKRQAKNQWMYGMLSSGEQITAEMIDTFFEGVEEHSVPSGKKMITTKVDVGSCPHVQGRMVIPYGPRFIDYEGQKFVNTSTVNVKKGKQENLLLGKLVLELAYRALVTGDELHPDRRIESDILFEQVMRNDYTNQDFRFLLNWNASIVQNPGINLQTNLWLLGQQEGVGKGTWLTLMSHILGYDAVGDLDQTEVEAGWTDHLFGKLLIGVNEFDATGKMSPKAWNKWFKRHTCEAKLPIRRRNTTSWSTLNIGNYMFMTNEEIPGYMDKTDRRNQVIKTTPMPYWKEFASQMQINCVVANPEAIASGLAFILENVKVDPDLIKSAYINEAKADIQTASADGTPEEWVKNDMTINRGAWTDVGVLYSKYKDYKISDHPSSSIMTRNMFSRVMKKIPCVSYAEFGSMDEQPSHGGGPRKRPTNEFKIDRHFDPKGANRDDVARDFQAFTDITPAKNYDQEQPTEAQLSEKAAKMQRMREMLAKQYGPSSQD